MTDITERTEALLTAMGWTRRLNGMWAVDVPKWERDTVTAARPSIDWCFRHAITWATEHELDVSVRREKSQQMDGEWWHHCTVRIRAVSDVGNHNHTMQLAKFWLPGEPDRTAEAIVTALYDALMGERDG